MNTYFWQIWYSIDMVLLNVLVFLASLSVTLIMCKKKKKDMNVSKRVLVNRNSKKCVHSVADSNRYPNRHQNMDTQSSVKVSSNPLSRSVAFPSSQKYLKMSEKPSRLEDWNEEELAKELLYDEREDEARVFEAAVLMSKTAKSPDVDSSNQTPSKSTEKSPSHIKTDRKTDKPKDAPKTKERAKSKTKKTKKEVKKSLKDSKRSKDQKKMENVEKEEEIRVKLMDDPPGENEEEQSATRLTELYSDQLKLVF